MWWPSPSRGAAGTAGHDRSHLLVDGHRGRGGVRPGLGGQLADPTVPGWASRRQPTALALPTPSKASQPPGGMRLPFDLAAAGPTTRQPSHRTWQVRPINRQIRRLVAGPCTAQPDRDADRSIVVGTALGGRRWRKASRAHTSTAWWPSPACQGLPDYVEDPATIAWLVRLILAGRPRSGPPDDLDAEGVEDVATPKAGMQDHPLAHGRQDRGAPAQPLARPALPQHPLPTGRAASLRMAAWLASARMVIAQSALPEQ
jgi:hypothetical protein